MTLEKTPTRLAKTIRRRMRRLKAGDFVVQKTQITGKSYLLKNDGRRVVEAIDPTTGFPFVRILIPGRDFPRQTE